MLGGGIYDGVYRLVEEWPSKIHRSEPAYREDLYDYLLANVHHHAVRKEAGASRADIGVGSQVAIELKYDFESKDQVRTLFTQIAQHKNSFSEGVICVFCGGTRHGSSNRAQGFDKREPQEEPRVSVS